MKNKRNALTILTLLIIAAIALTACGTAGAQTGTVDTPAMQAPASQETTLETKAVQGIDLETAKEIALSNAGLTAAQVTFSKAELDWDDGVAKYEIAFATAGCEFEYDIHADTGAILAADREQFSAGAAKTTPQTTKQQAVNANRISLDRAKEIALANAGCSTAQVTFNKAELDWDDGVAKYEIEFVANGWEYECNIHAGTGTILGCGKKQHHGSHHNGGHNNSVQTNHASDITLKKAKSIALADAGLTASQVTFKKATLSRYDGVTTYEIEFTADGWEYEYDIHAGTGVILERDKERID